VVNGQIDACKWVRAACSRHLRDLQQQKDPNFPFRFDEARASRACRFIEALPHVKDDFNHRAAKGERIKLCPWQKFVVVSIFGWLLKHTNTYRFRLVYVCVPRKNGKSILAAAIGLYKLAADGEFGAEVFSGATTEKQAWEVFRPAKNMAERTPELRRAFNITVNAKSLAIEKTASRFQPVIGKPGDGASPSCAIVDEYHEHPTDDLFDTMQTGMGARQNPLLLVITTAGSDRSGPCYALQQKVQAMLDGKVQNERLFGVIYTIDEADDWMAPEALRKANPNYDVSVEASFLLDAQRDAVQNARNQNIFKTKHLNVWVNADIVWMNMVKWDACADEHLALEQFLKDPCMIGVDLASRIDMAAKVKLFRRNLEGKAHFYAFGTYYLNEAAVDNVRNMHYQGWFNQNRLVVTPGNVTDYNWIANDLIQDGTTLYVREVPHDPYHAAALIQFIQARADWNQGVPFVEVRQTVQQMSPAMKELEAIVLDGRFHHDGDPVLGWMVSNVVCHRDAKDNIFPRKEREENKIDGVIALLMALNRWMAAPSDITDGVVEFW
jgi:phage terminase large subunit-like protein